MSFFDTGNTVANNAEITYVFQVRKSAQVHHIYRNSLGLGQLANCIGSKAVGICFPFEHVHNFLTSFLLPIQFELVRM